MIDHLLFNRARLLWRADLVPNLVSVVKRPSAVPTAISG